MGSFKASRIFPATCDQACFSDFERRDHGKFVAANPKSPLSWDNRCDAFRGTGQQTIAAWMAEGIVHLLEIVEVDQEQPPGARDSQLEGGQRLVEVRPIGEAGQGIREGEPMVLDLLRVAFDGNRAELGARRDGLLLDRGGAAVFPEVERECAEHALARVKNRTGPTGDQFRRQSD